MAINEKIIKCNVEDENLFDCIVKELYGEDYDRVINDPTLFQNEVIVNCVNAGLVSCLGGKKSDLKAKISDYEIELVIIKTENKVWRVRDIIIKVDIAADDKLIIKGIESCLKYIKNSCNINKEIEFTIENIHSSESFKNLKVHLEEIKEWISEVRDDKAKQEKLFKLFTK